ncbi:hypothetical protein GQ54DRAFT_296961 [Martensiomyces pterosporus]|nr:hypothetical protein GQ54DRAFT_296961 [Martensiomyces pterosporus]
MLLPLASGTPPPICYLLLCPNSAASLFRSSAWDARQLLALASLLSPSGGAATAAFLLHTASANSNILPRLCGVSASNSSRPSGGLE